MRPEKTANPERENSLEQAVEYAVASEKAAH